MASFRAWFYDLLRYELGKIPIRPPIIKSTERAFPGRQPAWVSSLSDFFAKLKS
jgi:hypothetical protein